MQTHILALLLAVTDTYGTMSEACKAESSNRIILRHCKWRSYHGSRDDRYTSRIDATKIHDRDRGTAHMSVENAKASGWFRPDTCEHHQIWNLPHPEEEIDMVKNWPFVSEFSKSRQRKWRKASHDYERFGTRGPIDLVPAYHSRFIGDGCVDPAVFDRRDISAAVHNRRAKGLLGFCADTIRKANPLKRKTWKGRRWLREEVRYRCDFYWLREHWSKSKVWRKI